MEQTCVHCDHPDSSLLRVVMIGELVRADESMLYDLAEVFQTFGLLEAAEEDTMMYEMPRMCQANAANSRNMLRLVK
jgi:hypothetical protein